MLEGTLYSRNDDTTCHLKGTSTTHFPKHSVDSHVLAIQCRQERQLMHDVCACNMSTNVPVALHLALEAVSMNHTSQVYLRDICKFDSLDLCEQQGFNH